MHALYIAACQESGFRTLSMSSFRSVWRQCLDHIKFMTPRTDVCDRCEKLRRSAATAVGEAEKLAACQALSQHVQAAQAERDHYRQLTQEAVEELRDYALGTPTPHSPCSSDLKKVHYTFDFAQNVSLPHNARQVGPLYFKTPIKVQLFGINSEGIPKQVNYLLHEADTIGEDGKGSHGPNTVVR